MTHVFEKKTKIALKAAIYMMAAFFISPFRDVLNKYYLKFADKSIKFYFDTEYVFSKMR